MLRRSPLILAAVLSLAGCEYFGSDVATRIRYALGDAQSRLQRADKDTLTIVLKPNHWPDSCGTAPSYRVILSPYKGNKYVAVGDIFVECAGGRHYYTGFGSEQIYVSESRVVEKKAGDELRVTLKRTRKGTEIVALE